MAVAAAEIVLPELTVGQRYKVYFKKSGDPNMNILVGTFAGRVPQTPAPGYPSPVGFRFTDVIPAAGNAFVPQYVVRDPLRFTYVPVPDAATSGGRRKRRSRRSRRHSRKGSRHVDQRF